MLRLSVLVVCSLVALVAVAQPDVRDKDNDDDEDIVPAPPPAIRGASLVRPDAVWRWQTVRVPRIPRQLGAMTVSGADVVAGRAKRPADPLGDAVPAPARWPFALDGATTSAIGKPADDERIAAAFGITTFKLGPADQGYEMLELRLHYEDTVAVWINGVEVARQLPRTSTTTTISTVPHGPEWETFYIPVAPGLLALGDNTLAIEVHPSHRRNAPTLFADLVARRDRGIVRGPVLVDTAATTATIAVETDPNVEAVLEWGIGDASDRKVTSPPGKRHRFTLSNLPANKAIGYRVHAGASRSPRYVFHTLPTATSSVIRLGIYGDVRGGHATHRRLVEHMLAEGLDAVAVTGDMVLHGSDDADWQRFFAITGELLATLPYYPALGNHDVGWDGADGTGKADQVFALPQGPANRPDGAYWYSRELADLHLVFLDSNAYDRPEQETWLDGDLAAARKRKVRAILVFTHDGPYSRGYHGGSAIARERYVPILTKYKVDLLVSGHDHLYQRGDKAGLHYVVSGGGGASLYAIRCGVAGRRPCKEPDKSDGMQMIAREHHYLVASVGPRELELCARRPDGTLLEKCVRYKLARP
ncbi:MAG TPA: metallophosphoesterase [Kofleriaceae bacterium]|nr:metallophosphoesterase [Kofleriaceae bacterium]